MIVHKFLSKEINGQAVVKNQWGGFMTRQHLHEILFDAYIVEDVIDCGAQMLMEKTSVASNEYHSWTYVPAFLLHNLMSPRFSKLERINNLSKALPNLRNMELIFFTAFTTNHWHLVVVDLTKKSATAYNSLKENKLYIAGARQFVRNNSFRN